MAQPKRKEQDQQQEIEKVLKSSLKKLEEHTEKHLTEKYGISENFSQKIQNSEAAQEMCENAIETLATEFIEQLTTFQQSTNPQEALTALDRAETLWQAESKIIAHLDTAGEEKRFLQEVRQQTLQVLNQKLEETARKCKTKTTDENIALIIATLSVMDHILFEQGLPTEHPDRLQLRQIATNFQ